jgi:hypothetical protein
MNTVTTKKFSFPSKKRTNKTQQRKNRFVKNRVTSVRLRDFGGMPDIIKVTLKTSIGFVGLGVSTAVANGKSYFLNQGTTGILGWPTFSGVYDSYMVHAARIKVFFSNTSTTIPVRCLIFPYDTDLLTSLPLTEDDTFVEAKYAKTAVVSNSGGGRDSVSVSNSVSVSELVGFQASAQQVNLTGYTGSANSISVYTAPLDQWKWYVSVQSMTGAYLASN